MLREVAVAIAVATGEQEERSFHSRPGLQFGLVVSRRSRYFDLPF